MRLANLWLLLELVPAFASYRAAAEIIPVGIEPPALRSGRKAWRMDLSDHTRFEELVLPHLDAACNLARWLPRDVNDAEDVVQEACVRALKYVGSLNGGGGRAWFLTIVRHARLARARAMLQRSPLLHVVN